MTESLSLFGTLRKSSPGFYRRSRSTSPPVATKAVTCATGVDAVAAVVPSTCVARAREVDTFRTIKFATSSVAPVADGAAAFPVTTAEAVATLAPTHGHIAVITCELGAVVT